MPELCTPTAPVDGILSRLAELIKDGPDGVPGFPPAPYVTGFVDGVAPPHHYLLQAGMRVYTGNEAVRQQPPCVLIWNNAKAEKRHKQFPKLWDVPVCVHFCFDRVLPPEDLATKMEEVEMLLFTDYEGEGGKAIQRLSRAGSHRVRDIDNLSIDPFTVAEAGYTTVQASFTLYCSGLQEGGGEDGDDGP